MFRNKVLASLKTWCGTWWFCTYRTLLEMSIVKSWNWSWNLTIQCFETYSETSSIVKSWIRLCNLTIQCMETCSETPSIVKAWNRLWNLTIQCMETCLETPSIMKSWNTTWNLKYCASTTQRKCLTDVSYENSWQQMSSKLLIFLLCFETHYK